MTLRRTGRAVNLGWSVTGAVAAAAVALTEDLVDGHPRLGAALLVTAGGLALAGGAAAAARSRRRYWPRMAASSASMALIWAAVFLFCSAAYIGWLAGGEPAVPGPDALHLEPGLKAAIYCLAVLGLLGGALTAVQLAGPNAITHWRTLATAVSAAAAVVLGTYVTVVGFYLAFGVLARVVGAAAGVRVLCAAVAGALGGAVGGIVLESALWTFVGRRRAADC